MAKEVTCAASNCKFRVRSENEDELVAIVQQHAKNNHQTELSREQILQDAKESEESAGSEESAKTTEAAGSTETQEAPAAPTATEA